MHVASLRAGDVLPGETMLGEGGLGLDSIAIAELIVAYEDRFGITAVELLEGEPLTVGMLIGHAASAS